MQCHIKLKTSKKSTCKPNGCLLNSSPWMSMLRRNVSSHGKIAVVHRWYCFMPSRYADTIHAGLQYSVLSQAHLKSSATIGSSLMALNKLPAYPKLLIDRPMQASGRCALNMHCTAPRACMHKRASYEFRFSAASLLSTQIARRFAAPLQMHFRPLHCIIAPPAIHLIQHVLVITR